MSIPTGKSLSREKVMHICSRYGVCRSDASSHFLQKEKYTGSMFRHFSGIEIIRILSNYRDSGPIK